MKVLFVGAQADLYGASRMLFRMAGCLIDRGIRVVCVLPGDGPMVGRIREIGAEVHLVPEIPVLHRRAMRWPGEWAKMVRDSWRSAGKLTELCAKARVDLIHTNTSAILPFVGGVARRCGLPHVQHMREFYSGFGPLWLVYRKALVRGADAVVCVSEAVAAQMRRTSAKTHVVYDGFAEDDFRTATPEAIREFRQRLGVAEDMALVGMVGRIKSRRKGQDVFLRAAAQLARSFSEVRFLIVGAPFMGNESDLAGLRCLAQKLGIEDRVIWTGELPETKTAFASMDVAVMPSVDPEPFGNTTLEAMLQERAVVATATGGTPEQIQDGVNGVLIPPNSPQALADAVTVLLRDRDRRLALGRRARESVKVRFNAGRMTDQLMSVYGLVLA